MNGFWERVTFAVRCFFSILFHGDLPNDVNRNRVDASRAQQPAASVPSASRLEEVERPAPEALDRAVQILALLQRDGRLIDFLEENISTYPDAQLGAGVRTIHGKNEVDSSKAIRELSAAFRPFEETVRDEVQWFRSHGYTT